MQNADLDLPIMRTGHEVRSAVRPYPSSSIDTAKSCLSMASSLPSHVRTYVESGDPLFDFNTPCTMIMWAHARNSAKGHAGSKWNMCNERKFFPFFRRIRLTGVHFGTKREENALLKQDTRVKYLLGKEEAKDAKKRGRSSSCERSERGA